MTNLTVVEDHFSQLKRSTRRPQRTQVTWLYSTQYFPDKVTEPGGHNTWQSIAGPGTRQLHSGGLYCQAWGTYPHQLYSLHRQVDTGDISSPTLQSTMTG